MRLVDEVALLHGSVDARFEEVVLAELERGSIHRLPELSPSAWFGDVRIVGTDEGFIELVVVDRAERLLTVIVAFED